MLDKHEIISLLERQYHNLDTVKHFYISWNVGLIEMENRLVRVCHCQRPLHARRITEVESTSATCCTDVC